ncbi:MAG TPA: nitrogen regulation protein NR(II) [Gammaproteobacteria bacterium]|jgi:two-component system nitrogen regulation sensor histidine kinase GlnL|nr:nitrogen regulation protein NR(II) [Gammaproteobacteria bacterium]
MHKYGATSPRFIDSIVENQTTGILWLDAMLTIRYLNPAAETLLELSGLQALGADIGHCLPSATSLLETLARARQSGEICTRRELILELGASSRRHITMDLTVTPIVENGQQTELLVELIPLERHLHISREEELSTRHTASRALALRLAHEIKNPLGGMRGAAQLLERKLAEPRLLEYTRIIVHEVDRLASLVDTLLGPSRLPQRIPTNLHERIDHVIELMRAETGNRIHWQRDYDPSLPELTLDRDEITQVLINLARNAVEAIGNAGNISFRTRVARQYTLNGIRHRLVTRVEVIDDGPGVPDALQARLFTPLVSGKPNGTGLGLAIAQELVNRHGGLIECNSVPGNTVFSILLPFGNTHEQRQV